MPPVGALRKLEELLARDDIFQTLEPVNKLSCLCGLYFPFGGRRRLLFLFFSLSVLCSFFYWGATSNLRHLGVLHLWYLFQAASVSFSLLYQNLRRRELDRVLKKIREADYFLAAFGMKFRYSLSFLLWLLPALGLLLLLHGFLSPNQISPVQLYFWGLLGLHIYLLSLRPRLVLAALADHFSHITHRLRYVSGSPDTRTRQAKVKALVRVYGLLADAAHLHNKSSLHVAVLVFHGFLSVVLKLFHVYSQFRSFYTPDRESLSAGLLKLLNNLALVFMWARVISAIVKPSVRCKEEAESFTSILFDLVYDGTSRQLTNSEELNLFLLARREVLLTAAGIFPLDNTLFYSMMASACSYLLFTIQLF